MMRRSAPVTGLDVVGHVGEGHERLALREGGQRPFRQPEHAEACRREAALEDFTTVHMWSHRLPFHIMSGAVRPILPCRDAPATILNREATCTTIVSDIARGVDRATPEPMNRWRRRRFHRERCLKRRRSACARAKAGKPTAASNWRPRFGLVSPASLRKRRLKCAGCVASPRR